MAKTINLHGRNYVVMSPNSERAKHVIKSWEWSSDVDLRDAYGRYSRAKENAYEYCRAREQEFNSWNGRITGHNSSFFSYAFTGMCEDRRYLIYITHCNDYAIDITDVEDF